MRPAPIFTMASHSRGVKTPGMHKGATRYSLSGSVVVSSPRCGSRRAASDRGLDRDMAQYGENCAGSPGLTLARLDPLVRFRPVESFPHHLHLERMAALLERAGVELEPHLHAVLLAEYHGKPLEVQRVDDLVQGDDGSGFRLVPDGLLAQPLYVFLGLE